MKLTPAETKLALIKEGLKSSKNNKGVFDP